MEHFALMLTLGTLVGVFSVVVGGGMFLSMPIFQVLFPSTALGVLVGNIKVGSLLRAVTSSWVTRKEIRWRQNLGITLVLSAATGLGATVVSGLDQRWAIPVLVLAAITAEWGPKLSRRITRQTQWIAIFAIGIYAGLLGAGIGPLLVALLRLKIPADESIAAVKIQARLVEGVLCLIAVVAHFLHGNLVSYVWLPWGIGSLAGGFLGGLMLLKLGILNAWWQRLALRLSMGFSLLGAVKTAL